MIRKTIIIIIFILLSINSVSAYADFINGGFETGNMDGWTLTNPPYGASVSMSTPIEDTWSCWMNMANPPVNPGIYQIIDLTGADGFSFKYQAGINDNFKIYVDGVEELSVIGGGDENIIHTAYIYVTATGDTEIKVQLCTTHHSYAIKLDSFKTFAIAPHIFNFKDECGNLFTDGTIQVSINNTNTGCVYGYTDNPVVFDNAYFTMGDPLEISLSTAGSGISWDTVATYGITQNYIDTLMEWDLELTVRHAASFDLLANTKVDMDFGCRADGANVTQTAYTNAQGKVMFYDLMGQSMDMYLSKAGYNDKAGTLDGSGFSAQVQHYTLTLYMTANTTPPDDPNPPIPLDPPFPFVSGEKNVFFTDLTNHTITSVDNYLTDEIRMWYQADDTPNTLYFQKFNGATYDNVLNWGVVANELSYKTIYKNSFITPETYRGKISNGTYYTYYDINIYNSSIGYDLTINTFNNVTLAPLNGVAVSVIGESQVNTGAGNTAIFSDLINNTLYEYYATKTGYAATDIYNVNIQGSSISVDLYLDPYFQFTIDVYDNLNAPLTNSIVYLSGHGSKNTGTNNFATFTNIIAGSYLYQASKSGYITSTQTLKNVIDCDVSVSASLMPVGGDMVSSITITDDGRLGYVNTSTPPEADVYLSSSNLNDYNVTIAFIKGYNINISNITLTYSDFTENHYIYQPIFTYSNNWEYTAQIFNATGELLSTDTINCLDEIVNTYNFTIHVFKEGGDPLINSYVHLDTNIQYTGVSHSYTFLNVGIGTYTYLASHAGYISSTPTTVDIVNQDLSTNIFLVEGVAPTPTPTPDPTPTPTPDPTPTPTPDPTPTPTPEGNTYNLTVNVFNETGTQLLNSICYVSGESSINTELNNYAIFTVYNGTHYYKATHHGYLTSALSPVNINGGDESVNINLIVGTTTTGNTQTTKMSDTQIKNIFLPFMYILLIALLIGGFFYVSK